MTSNKRKPNTTHTDYCKKLKACPPIHNGLRNQGFSGDSRNYIFISGSQRYGVRNKSFLILEIIPEYTDDFMMVVGY